MEHQRKENNDWQTQVIGKAREGHGADQRLSRFFTAQVRQNGKTAPGRWPLFVVGACRDDARLSADVYGALLHKIRLDVPSKERRGAMLRWILDENCLDVGVEDFDVLVRLSHGLHFGDLNAIVSLATRSFAFVGPHFLKRRASSVVSVLFRNSFDPVDDNQCFSADRHTAKQLAATTGSTIINRPSLDHAIGKPAFSSSSNSSNGTRTGRTLLLFLFPHLMPN